jgi:hypothetical protein
LYSLKKKGEIINLLSLIVKPITYKNLRQSGGDAVAAQQPNLVISIKMPDIVLHKIPAVTALAYGKHGQFEIRNNVHKVVLYFTAYLFMIPFFLDLKVTQKNRMSKKV